MPGEGRPTQRGLVGRRVALHDVQLATKYAFPFVGADWAVPFIVLDVLGGRPQILASRAVLRGGEIRADAAEDDLRPIESLPVEGFARLAHFDPWWIFRGIGGVERRSIDAILRTNVAGTHALRGRRMKVHDLEFALDLSHLDAVVAKDDAFRVARLAPGDVDLLALRAPAKTL
ncbi:MAG TPA: hypothetical protein VJ326_07720 [Thermoplasmata archaeon]|nr:hypothetical protein [Thermoplasmata archaeon]